MTDESTSWGKRALSAVRSAALVLVVLVAVVSVAAVLSGRYQARPVLSGSMRPGLPVGGVVITKRVPAEALQIRDVIVFHRPDIPSELVVHRIISLHHVNGGVVIKTQGDNNPVKDPWKVTLRGASAYRAQFSVPLVGYLSIWWHQPLTRTIALALAACCLVGMIVALLWPRFRRKQPAAGPDEPEAATATWEPGRHSAPGSHQADADAADASAPHLTEAPL